MNFTQTAHNIYTIKWTVPCWISNSETSYRITHNKCKEKSCKKKPQSTERIWSFTRSGCVGCMFELTDLKPCQKYNVCLIIGNDPRSEGCLLLPTVCNNKEKRVTKDGLSIELTSTLILSSILVIAFTVTVVIIKLRAQKYAVEIIHPRLQVNELQLTINTTMSTETNASSRTYFYTEVR